MLNRFTGSPDGALPYAGLIGDSEGNLYGSTAEGGTGTSCSSGCGIVFKLDKTGVETVLHNFTGVDGAFPNGSLTLDSAGNLYGTTQVGGITTGMCGANSYPPGCGVVFKMDAAGAETVLHSFTGRADGAYPATVYSETQQATFTALLLTAALLPVLAQFV